jgi:hypothetical protein
MSYLVPSTRNFAIVGIAIAAVVALLIALGADTQTGKRTSGTFREASGDSSPAASVAEPGVPAAKRQGEAALATDTAAVAEGGGTTESKSPDATGGTVLTTSPPADLGVKIIQNASLQLRVKRGTLDDQLAEVQVIASTAGGYVVSSSLNRTVDGDPKLATMTIRVPARRFGSAMKELKGLGSIRGMDVTTEDVTQEYVDVKSRLRHDRAVEGRLLSLLAKSTIVNEALAVQARLDTVQEQIEVSQGRLNYLDQLTQLSTITITLRERARPGESSDDDGVTFGTGDAFKEAGERFMERINNGIVRLGGALPGLLLLAALGLVGYRIWRRRRPAAEMAERGASVPHGERAE